MTMDWLTYLPYLFVAFLVALAVAMRWLGAGRYVGLTYMLMGVALMVALHVYGLTFSNFLLLVTLGLVLLGFVVHVWTLKRESRY